MSNIPAPIETAWDIHCEHCWCALSIHDKKKFASQYFQGGRLTCPECKGEIDWWDSTLKSIRTEVDPMETCLPIGARRTFISSILQHNQETELRLSDYGIPSDAVIVRLNYNSTSDGGLSPIELLNNPSERHSIPPVVRFYPRPVGEGPYQETSFCLMVTWIPTAKEDISWQSLIEAFHHFVIGRFNPAIITANTAIESRMGVLLTEFLETRFTKKHYKEHIKGKFLENAATYYYQLNVVLPALLSFADSPPLPEHINRVLNDLINNRNKLTHTGLPKKPITKDGAAELLCGALFGIHYLDLIKPILLKG